MKNKTCEQLSIDELYKKIDDIINISLGVCCIDKETIEDLVHDVFLMLYQKNKTHSSISYIVTCVKNKYIDIYRRENRKKHLELTNNIFKNVIHGIYEQEEFTYDEEMFKKLTKCVECLSPTYKKIFLLKSGTDMTHKDIANRMDISDVTSKTNYMKAKRNILKMYNS